MGLFGGGSKVTYSSPATETSKNEAKDTAKDTAAKKQRLLATSGGNKGQQLTANQGQSVRHVFGN